MESFLDHKDNKSINLLIRILNLEKLNSYSNRAVTGGLDEFLKIHKRSLKSYLKFFPINNSSYLKMSPGMRKTWADKVVEEYSKGIDLITNSSKQNRGSLNKKNST